MARLEDLTIYQGTDTNIKLNIADTDGTPKDLSTKLFSASLKKSYSSSETPVEFTTTVIDAVNGVITLSLDDTQTAALDHTRRYVYDVFMYESGNTNIEAILEGKVFVKPTVTRVG